MILTSNMNILKNKYYDFYEYIHNLSYLNVPETYIIGGILSIIVTILYILLNKKSKIVVNVPRKFSIFSGDNRPRFRKRDKIFFYGRKVLRTVRGSINTSDKQRKLYRILSRGLLNRKNRQDSSSSLSYYKNEPNEYLLDFESSLLEKAENYNHQLPSALINLIRSVKVFGYFDQKIILEICKYMETKVIYAGNYLFKIGDPDDSIFVVESGKVHVFITDDKGQKHLIKECVEGDHVFSLLSVMDVLTNTVRPYKTVSAKAVEDTSILRLPGKAFSDVLNKYPESLVRITQIIMVRLQRVTFTALHNYLGLTSEIMKMEKKKERKSSTSSRNYHNQLKYAKSRMKSKLIENEANFYIDSCEKKSIETSSSSSSIVPEAIHQKSQTQHEYRKIVASTSEDENFNCNRSEYGETLNTNELYDELNEIEASLGKLLRLDDMSVLKDRISLMSISEGTVLNREGDHQNCQLIFVVRGLLDATQRELNGEDSIIFHVYAGEIAGSLCVLTGEPSQFTFISKQDSDIALISKENFYQIISVKPCVVLPLAHMIVKRMSPFVRQIDFALEWNLIQSGATLFRQNQKSDNIYIVLNGRLRSILSPSNTGPKQLVGEYGRGDLVGIVEVLMETNTSTTVMAIRDTEVTQIPTGLLNYIKYRHPRVVTRLIQLLSSRLLGNIQNNVTATPYMDASLQLKQPIDAPTIVSNLCTVAILPVSDDVPLDAFTIELKHALSAIDSTLLLTKEYIIQNLGKAALERVNEYRLLAWLGQQEDHHRIVLYQCERRLTQWTKRCLRQADCLLIVGLAANSPAIGQLEKEIETFAIRAQKELVLLHKMDGSRPSNTVNWLKNRGWCTSYHHVRCSKYFFATNEQNLNAYYHALKSLKVDKHSGFSRLARFLTGTSVGLVLGGGGARGCSHVGVIKALKEANIPIDMIGGTSIGSFMGALYADELDFDRMDKRAHQWSNNMNSYLSQVLDLTYPLTSMFTGRTFNKTIEDVFADRQIEDLWIPYFCITTDISASKMRIHTSAPLCDPYDGHLLVDGCYVNNLPGCVWRYVRASMSLSGYFAPMCDPVDGHLLLDGGYVNNLPADVMHRMGINIVLAVDVGSKDDVNFTNYGDTLSGWWLLWKKWNHWAAPVKVPDLTEIQSRLAYVSCQRQLEVVKNSSYCEYLRPPIDKFRTIQFGSYEEIRNVGYEYANMICDVWSKHNGSCEEYLEKNRLFCMRLNGSSSKYKLRQNLQHDTSNKLNHVISSVYNTQYQQEHGNQKFNDLSQLVHQQNEKILTRKQSRASESVSAYNQEIHSFSCGDEALNDSNDEDFDAYSSSLNDESSVEGIQSEPNLEGGYTSAENELVKNDTQIKLNSQTE